MGYAEKLGEAFGFLFPDEIVALKKYAALVQNTKENPVIVNIGSGAGTSGLAFREACPSATIYTIDNSEGGPLGGLLNEQNAFQNTGLELPKEILGDSSTVGREWIFGRADIVFIDGDHSQDGITKDIEAWTKHVASGGFMMFHDYTRDVWPDVQIVVDRFFYPIFEHVNTLAIVHIPDNIRSRKKLLWSPVDVKR